jgi:hypothetical protein
MRCLLLSATLALLGCHSTGPTTAPSSPPASKPVLGTASAPALAADASPTPVITPPAPVSQEPTTRPPPPTFKEAMVGLTRCDRAADGLMLASPGPCLQPMKQARAALLQATDAAGPAEEHLALIVSQLLSHSEPTVILYTLLEHHAYLRATPETIRALEPLVDSLLAPIAEAAAIARLGLHGATPSETRERALALFAAHPQRRVRHAACQHLGRPLYKADRAVFKTLLAAASDPALDLLLRSCAAREAGHVATARDLKVLIGLLDTVELQQPTIVGLLRGLGTPKAIAAYVRWFDRHATQPDKIHWTALHVFLPWDTELARMPREPTIKALRSIAAHRGHTGQIRTLAIKGLSRLKAEGALNGLRKAASPDDPPEVLKALRG